MLQVQYESRLPRYLPNKRIVVITATLTQYSVHAIWLCWRNYDVNDSVLLVPDLTETTCDNPHYQRPTNQLYAVRCSRVRQTVIVSVVLIFF